MKLDKKSEKSSTGHWTSMRVRYINAGHPLNIIKMRSFNIFDFPKKEVYVLLEDNFRGELFDSAIKKVGSLRKLGKHIGVSATMILKWKKGSNKNQIKECAQSIPLSALYKLYLLLNETKSFTLEKIQENILEYKAKGGSPVSNPNLPLIEDERLVRLFFHIAGDGYAGRYGKGKPHYYNIETNVMKEFIRDLSVFGDVKVRLEENGKRVFFSRVVGHIMKYIYKTDFLSNSTRIPKEFFKLDNKIIAQGIKAYADDEGSVSSYRVRICSMNKYFLKDMLDLSKLKFPKLANCMVITRHNDEYYLVIHSRGMRFFKELIDFIHSQKRRDLEFYLSIKKGNHKTINKPKIQILKVLCKKEKTTKMISYETRLYTDMVLKHILGYKSASKYYIPGLKEQGLVEVARNKNHKGGYLWRLTDKGRKLLSNEIKA